MQTSSEIHSIIQASYRKTRDDHEYDQKEKKEAIYRQIPRIEEIDKEISMLAIKSAKKVLRENITPQQASDYVSRQAKLLNEEKENLLTRYGMKMPLLQYDCSFCKDTGYIPDGKKCRCYIKKMQSLISLPNDCQNAENKQLQKCTFDKFKLSFYSKTVDSSIGYAPYDMMKQVLNRCRKFVNSFNDDSMENILLYGPSGLGKTLLAGSMTNAIVDKGYFAYYISSYKLFQFLEDYKFGRVNREDYSILYSSIYDCDLLVIDDFGTEFITSYTQSVFFDLLNSRLNMGKSMIISTNLTFDKLNDVYQERVMSRLCNEFTVLRFFGEDIRAIKNNQ